MNFCHYQNSIALPHKNTPGNIVAILLGWGNTSRNGEESECLKETKVAVLTNKECNEKYPRIMATQMCGFNGKGTGFCNGDSGNPLAYRNEVIGIVSFSASCKIRYPDNYTRVYKYMDFITQVIATT
ncbi:hypothetical protein PV326_004791 [Microctonus aethiopoides]|nr:hypothetical protein PV326_004791 [Microctonus aethiopoides]